MFRIAFLSLFIATIASAQAALRATADEFLHAYAAGDPITMHAVWSAADPKARAVFDYTIASALRVKCYDAAGAYVTSISDDHVVNGTIGRWAMLRAGDPTPRFELKNLAITFRERNGKWEVVKVDSAESLLADKIAANPAAAAQLLAENRDLVDGDLVTALTARIVNSVVGSQRDGELIAGVQRDVVAMLGEPALEANVDYASSYLKGHTGDVKGQLATALNAVRLAERGHDPDLLARTLVAAGRLYERTAATLPQGAESYERAFALVPQIESPTIILSLLGNYGSLKIKQDEQAEALSALERGEQIAESIGDVYSALNMEVGIGVLFQRQGNDALAEVHWQHALSMAATEPNAEHRRGEILTMLADRYVRTGRDKEAAAALDDSFAIGRKFDDAIIVGESYRVSAMARNRKRDYDNAIRDLDSGLEILRKGKRIHYIPLSQIDLAQTKFDAGQFRNAVETAEAAAAFSIGVNEDHSYVQSKTIAGKARLKLGEVDAALADFKDAIAVAESKRGFAAGDASAQELAFEKATAPYREASALLGDAGRIDEAFAMSERVKGRVLLDTLLSGRRQIDSVMTAEERRKNGELQNRLALLNRKLATENAKASRDPNAVAKLTSEIQTSRAEYETFQVALDAAHPRLRQTHGEMPVATREDIARMLDAESAIVEFQVMDDRTIAFVIKRNDIARIVIPIALDQLTKRVSLYAGILAHRDLGYRAASRSLYNTLLNPLEHSLRGVRVLCIIPDGVLWTLPFESLIAPNGRFVVESRSVFYAPSVSVLNAISHETHRGHAESTLLAVGDPLISQSTRRESKAIYRGASLAPLPYAEEEVKALRALYGAGASRVYTGKEANEAAVKADVGHFRILHFATHAEFNDENPMYAHIVLAQDTRDDDDGLLEAWEIMRMNLHADLAVLSACETAKGRVAPGEGIIGFSWALFVAGCPSSVVSHWKVASDSTARLMVDFHKHLLTGHGTFQKAAALRAAKLAMLHDKKWSHPFYWSAFVLVGRG